MAKFRKRPVEVEAVQFNGPFRNDAPTWLFEALGDGRMAFTNYGLEIRTLEGRMIADSGDWIIKGVKGEIYPCKPDIFAETYEAIDG